MNDDEFGAALAAKVAPPEGTTTTEETPTEPVENVAPDVEGETQAEPETPEEPKYKFASQAEAEKAHANIEQAFHRRDEEIRELRNTVEQASDNQRTQTPAQYGELQEALEVNPEGVAMWALENGNPEVLDQAVVKWYEKALLEEDPAALRDVNKFERAIEMAQFQHQLSSELSPALQGVKNEAEVRALALAQRELKAQYPDYDQVMESATEENVSGLDPEVIRQLKDRDPKKALDLIYRYLAVGRQVEQSSASDERKAEVLQEKRQAVVASSTSSPVEGTKSAHDLLKEYMLTPDEHSVHHGLTS